MEIWENTFAQMYVKVNNHNHNGQKYKQSIRNQQHSPFLILKFKIARKVQVQQNLSSATCTNFNVYDQHYDNKHIFCIIDKNTT
jgi:hypothetical protein